MLLFAASIVLTAGAEAANVDIQALIETQSASYGVDDLLSELPEEAYAVWGDLTLEEMMEPQKQMQRFWEELCSESGGVVHSAVTNVMEITLICFITAAARAFPMGPEHAELTQTIGAVTVAIFGVARTVSCIPEGVRIIAALQAFSSKLLPAVCAAATAAGAVTSAGIKYTIAALALNLFGTLATEILLPAIYVYIAMMLTGHVFQNDVLLSIGGFIKQLIRLLLLLTAGCFTLFLTVTGILNGNVDAAAAKAAKTAISTALPVVGGMLSDAAGAILSGAGLLCSCAGVLGLLCVASVCVLPYLSLGVHYLLYQIIGGACASVADSRVSGLLKSFSDVYAMLLGVVGTVSFIVFASIVSLMRAIG